MPVNTFELYLSQGQGKTSALAANGNLCQSQGKLVMPTEFEPNELVLTAYFYIRYLSSEATAKRSAGKRRGR